MKNVPMKGPMKDFTKSQWSFLNTFKRDLKGKMTQVFIYTNHI